MSWNIAQINIGTVRFPLDDPRIADFMDNLDRINGLADRSPGFVWRLQTDSGNATDVKVTDNPLFIVNMSVWESVEALFGFAYQTEHRDFMVRRREWFERPAGAYQALWWVPAGHQPTVEEGLARLARLERDGPSAAAFTFKDKYPPPGTAGEPQDLRPEPWCVGWR